MSNYNQPKGSRILIDDDSYYMGRLLMESVCCRDPEVQKAALLVNSKAQVIGFGFNYIVREFSTSVCSWAERNYALYTAEEMALDEALASGKDMSILGSVLYLTNPPTSVSLIRLLRFNVKKILYVITNDAAVDYQDWEKAMAFSKEKNLEVKPFGGNLNWMRDRIKKLDYLF